MGLLTMFHNIVLSRKMDLERRIIFCIFQLIYDHCSFQTLNELFILLLLSLSLSLFSPKSTSRQLDVDSGGEQCFFILGSGESKGQWVRSHWVQGWYCTETVNVKWNSVPLHIFFLMFFPQLQVLLRQEGRGHSQVMRTPNSAVVLALPEGGTYIIEVRAVSEGGEGAASAQVRVLTSSGKQWLGSHSQCGFSDLRICTYGSRLDCFR